MAILTGPEREVMLQYLPELLSRLREELGITDELAAKIEAFRADIEAGLEVDEYRARRAALRKELSDTYPDLRPPQ